MQPIHFSACLITACRCVKSCTSNVFTQTKLRRGSDGGNGELLLGR